MEKNDDRRVRRTRQLLREALHALIQEKGFEALTVQDIIDRANVGRSTFYAHYLNKEDLLEYGLKEFHATLRERRDHLMLPGASLDRRVFLFSHELFAHANDHRELFRAMVGKQSGAVVQKYFQQMLVELVREDVKARASPGGKRSTPIEAMVQYLAGGLFGLLMWWLDGKSQISVEEVDALFRELAIPALLRVEGTAPESRETGF